MKTRSLSISATASARRRLIASVLLMSVAAVLSLRLASGAHAKVSGGDAIGADGPVDTDEATLAVVADADPALESMIALHRGVMLAPLRTTADDDCCGPVAPH